MASAPGRDNPALMNSTLKLKPVIKELVRTQVCPTTLHLLLDRLTVLSVDVNGKQRETYRLWLSDGENSIQALLKHELHPFVTSGEIHEGSYLAISDCELGKLPRHSGNGTVWVLMISALEVAGSDGREPEPPEIEPEPVSTNRRSQVREKTPASASNGASEPRPSTRPKIEIAYDDPEEAEGSARRRLDVSPHDNHDESESQSESFESPRKLKRRLSADRHVLEPTNNKAEPAPKMQKKSDASENIHRMNSTTRVIQPNPEASSLVEIKRPLKVMPLSKLIGPRTVRNKVHDVLGVVCEVDAQVIRRRGMPEQRNLRITDTSTTKLVQLTVFVDAVNFTPDIGTVALFRNVTTHEWNGGSLKAYHRDCAGRQWFFPDPTDVDQEKLEQLKAHWSRVMTNQPAFGGYGA